MNFCAQLAPISSPSLLSTKGTVDYSVRICWARASKDDGTHSVISLEEPATED